MENFIIKFIEEATDLINALEGSILSLEANPEDEDIINEVFRIMHSLKGGGAMFGFEKISEFTHNMENIYDEIRNKKKKVTKPLLDVTLKSVDHLRNLLDRNILNNPKIVKKHNELLVEIEEILNTKSEILNTEKSESETPKKIAHSTYYILFKPNSDILDNGTNPLFMISDMYDLGKCIVKSQIENIPHIGNLDFSRCYVYWHILLQTEEDASEIEDIFMFVEDECKLEIVEIANLKLLDEKEFVDYFLNNENNNSEQLKEKAKDYLPQKIEEKENIDSENEKRTSEKIKKFKKESEITSIRIATEKIDQYMNLVSELVTAQARLKMISERISDPDLIELTEDVENITEQIRDNALSISLIPIESAIVRFRRLVRDLSSDFNKDIEFITEGTDTRIDKTLLQIITEPLMHIIRNCIDHGIESKEERDKTSKSEKGKILLRAYYSGSNVNIEIEDDGKGINVEKVTKKAIEKGLISQETTLSPKEAAKLIFLPGFSTSDKVSDISGRGVGMDVLKRKIADARGDIEIVSKQGIGTKITLKLPLTLSIIDGLLVELGNATFIVPLSSIAKIIDIKYTELENAKNNIAIIDGKQIPFYFIKSEFEIEGEYPEEVKFIMIKYEKTRVGFVFDTIIGEYQAVLKSLGKLYRQNNLISGATILGDGTVALVLDPNKIIQKLSGE